MASLNVHSTPAFRAAILFSLGIILGDGFDVPLGVSAALAVIISLCVAVLLFRYRSLSASPAPRSLSSLAHAALVPLLCLAVGASKISLDRHSANALPDNLVNTDVILCGTIDEPPQRVMTRTRFVVSSQWVLIDSHVVPTHENVLVSLQRTRTDSGQFLLEYGMKVALHGIISRPSDERNPGEFSARRYYEANGISLMVLLREASRVAVIDSSGGSWWMRSLVVPARRYMLTLIDQTIGGEEGEFLKGLLLGERGGLSSATREAFTNSGVAHILAVSGSNVAVVATILVFVSGFLRLPRALRTIAVSFGLLCYMVLSGNQPPVVRATIMALVFVLGRVFQEKQSVYNALGISALIILGIDARQLFDVGFQLSFVAVLSIVYLYPKVNAWLSNIPDRSAWRRATVWTLRVCAVSAVATLGTLPLTAMYFGRVSVIGIVSNIVVIPAAEVSVVLGFLSLGAGIFSSWLAGIYGEVNHLLLALTLWVTDLTGRLSFAYFETLRFMPADAIPFYAGLGLVTHLRVRDSARRCFVLFLAGLNIALFAPAPPQYARHSGTLRVSFIDVGQGDAMLVEFPDGKSMVIDAGPRNGSYDAGERTVVPFLKRRGISTVDLLVVTHPDNDHIAGAHAVFEQLDVRRVIDCGRPSASDTYEQYLDDVREEQCPHESVRAGRLITDFTGARLYVLSPLHSFVGGDATYSHESLNNSSVVMKVQYGFVSFLLTGDAEAGAEHDMVSAYGGFLRANVLKVGHHGSASGTSEEFLHCVQPVMAVISVGRNNRFHHPSSMIIHRLTDMQSHVLRTDEQGAIIMETDGRTFSCINWR